MWLFYVTQVGLQEADGLLCLFSATHHETGQEVAGSDGEQRKIFTANTRKGARVRKDCKAINKKPLLTIGAKLFG